MTEPAEVKWIKTSTWHRLMDQRATQLLHKLGLPQTKAHYDTVRAEIEIIDINARVDVYRMCRNADAGTTSSVGDERLEAWLAEPIAPHPDAMTRTEELLACLNLNDFHGALRIVKEAWEAERQIGVDEGIDIGEGRETMRAGTQSC